MYIFWYKLLAGEESVHF